MIFHVSGCWLGARRIMFPVSHFPDPDRGKIASNVHRTSIKFHARFFTPIRRSIAVDAFPYNQIELVCFVLWGKCWRIFDRFSLVGSDWAAQRNWVDALQRRTETTVRRRWIDELFNGIGDDPPLPPPLHSPSLLAHLPAYLPLPVGGSVLLFALIDCLQMSLSCVRQISCTIQTVEKKFFFLSPLIWIIFWW